TERFVKGLEARWGRHPVPLIHSWKTLDPSGRMFARPDALWGSMWEWLADSVPDDFEQTVVRRPIFGTMQGMATRFVDSDPLTTEPLAGSALSARLSEAEREKDPHLNPLPAYRERGQDREQTQYRDEMKFIGWRWVCPGCRKTVRKIYYRIAPLTVFDCLGYGACGAGSCGTQGNNYRPYDR